MARKNSVLDAIRAFNFAYDTTSKVGQDIELGRISNAKAEESTGFTAEQGKEIEELAASGKYNVGYDEGERAYKFSPIAVEGESTPQLPSKSIAMRGVTDFMGQRRAGSMSESEQNNARMMAMAGVLSKYGDPAGALRVRATANELQALERKRTDDDELRQALHQDPPGTQGSSDGMPTGTMTTLTTGVPVQAHQLAQATGQTSKEGGTAQPGGQFDLNAYIKNVAPRTMQTLVKQGRLDDAKRFQGFITSQDGQNYAKAWVNGMQRYSIGDHAGALDVFEKMYNQQLFNDGRTVKLTDQNDGKNYQIEIFDRNGSSLGASVQPVDKIANQAALFLEPSRAVEFHAKQTEARQHEAATTDRQLRVEGLRQQGRDERLVRRLGAPQGLTAAQQRNNFEIDAAREYVTDLDPADIRRRTAKTTDTGRENPDYDPALSKAATLAARRKIGEDSVFDSRGSRSQPAPAIDRQDVAKRFRADRGMNNYRLGKDTSDGVEVLDGSGKLVGHYR